MKEYSIKVELNEDGTKQMSLKNKGFSPLELLGLMELIQLDIMRQLMENVKPDILEKK